MGLYKGGNIGLKSKSRNNHKPFFFQKEKQTVQMMGFSINASAFPSVREHFHIAKSTSRNNRLFDTNTGEALKCTLQRKKRK